VRPASNDEIARQIQASALHLKGCAEKENEPASCEAEFSELSELLQRADSSHFELAKPGFFDVFVENELLIVRRRACADRDINGKVVAWSAWSQTVKPQSVDEIKSGQYGGYLPFNTVGRRFRGSCVAVIMLPPDHLKRLYVAMLNQEKTAQSWMVDHSW
jgi:hypothetical protein